MRPSIRALPIAATLAISACGGNSSPNTPSNLLAVAGTYATQATIIADRNTCGSVSVQDNPTVVTQTAGSTDVTLVHAGSTYRGSVDTAGRFSTPPANFTFPDADYTIGIAGQFSRTGFTATVDLTRRQGTTTCTYAVGWVGTKQGAPNVIPG